MSVSIKYDQSDVEAGRLAQRLQKRLDGALLTTLHNMYLSISADDGLSLSCPEFDAKAQLSICLHSGESDHRRRFGGGASQMIAKAVGIEQGIRPSIIDATLGLGGDAFVLASLGCSVLGIERSPILYAMLEDAMERALQACDESDEPDSLSAVLGRLKFFSADACEWLATYSGYPSEVIYLDPMFPERKKSAAVKKDMKILQLLLDETQVRDLQQRQQQEEKLLAIALEKASHRVVVKRPKIAPPLLGPAPGYQLAGKATRFDIYPLKTLRK